MKKIILAGVLLVLSSQASAGLGGNINKVVGTINYTLEAMIGDLQLAAPVPANPTVYIPEGTIIAPTALNLKHSSPALNGAITTANLKAVAATAGPCANIPMKWTDPVSGKTCAMPLTGAVLTPGQVNWPTGVTGGTWKPSTSTWWPIKGYVVGQPLPADLNNFAGGVAVKCMFNAFTLTPQWRFDGQWQDVEDSGYGNGGLGGTVVPTQQADGTWHIMSGSTFGNPPAGSCN
jgi:hypothetical protein